MDERVSKSNFSSCLFVGDLLLSRSCSVNLTCVTLFSSIMSIFSSLCQTISGDCNQLSSETKSYHRVLCLMLLILITKMVIIVIIYTIC